MAQLSTGEFFGSVCERTSISGALLSRVRHATGRRLPMHTHEAAYFSLLLSGHYSERVGSRSIDHDPGTLVFHPEGITHEDEVAPSGGVFFIIELDAHWFDDLRAREAGACPELAADALALYRAQHAIDAEERLWTLAAGAARVTTRHETSSPRWLQPVVDRLHDEHARSLTIARLASDAGVHPAHLSRTFRAHFGLTIGDYLHRIRLGFAMRELARGRNIGDVAYETGFADHAHMTRICRAVTGGTPKEMRRLLGGG